MKYAIHPDFRHLTFSAPLYAPVLRVAAPVMRLALKMMKVPKDISARQYVIRQQSGLKLTVQVFKPAGECAPLPCLLYFHGGAFCFPAAPYHQKLMMRYAKDVHCAVIVPDYHLLPTHPFPDASQDALCAYRWLVHNAANLGVDPFKTAVGGDSAGAVLAATVCAQASHKLCYQMLLYPVTDHRMKTASMKRYPDTPLWNAGLNKKMWKMYASGASREQIKTLSPMTWRVPPDVPLTYIETAEFDCLHDEGVAYAQKLQACGTAVILNQTQGTIHGYDMALSSQVTEKNIRIRISNLRQAFE